MSAHPLDPIFHPRAVAVVGVPSTPRPNTMGNFFEALMESGYPRVGGLYPVNPKASEISGVRCYPSLLDTPDPVDHVISQVPASVVPALVDQCIEKGIRSIHFFTAGFSETGDPRMADVENEVISKLRRAGIRAIGPNCMGLYVPSERLTFMDGFPMEPGNVFVLSQSGANAGEIVRELSLRGVRFSKGVSYGNGADVRAHDLLDYAANDPETEVVVAYIEGVQDGRAFFEALKRCARIKRTVILKGGLTQSGSNAARSHTGSLAGSSEIFDAVCRQTGAIRAETMEELNDLVVAASTNVRHVNGRGVVLFGGGGGGFAVLSADAIDREGLHLPPMPKAAVDRMREFIPIAGSSVNNPLDANPAEDRLEDMLNIVATAEGMDMVFMNPTIVRRSRREEWEESAQTDPEHFRREQEDRAKRAAQLMRRVQEETGTPVIGILRGGRVSARMVHESDVINRAAFEEGVGMFPSPARAARAVASVLEWRRYRQGMPDIL